jgi:hypothetical protein
MVFLVWWGEVFQCCRYPNFVCPFEVYLTQYKKTIVHIFALIGYDHCLAWSASNHGLQLVTIAHMDDYVGIMPGPYLYGLSFLFV